MKVGLESNSKLGPQVEVTERKNIIIIKKQPLNFIEIFVTHFLWVFNKPYEMSINILVVIYNFTKLLFITSLCIYFVKI